MALKLNKINAKRLRRDAELFYFPLRLSSPFSIQ